MLGLTYSNSFVINSFYKLLPYFSGKVSLYKILPYEKLSSNYSPIPTAELYGVVTLNIYCNLSRADLYQTIINIYYLQMITAYYNLILFVTSLALWLLFTYELFFLVSTRQQGYINPDIIYIMSFLLNVVTAYHSPLNQISNTLLFLGLTSITIGTRDEYYKCYVMAGLSLCWIALYYNYNYTHSSFGYIQTPTNNYGIVSSMVGNGEVFGGPATHLAHKSFAVSRPVPSNYTF